MQLRVATFNVENLLSRQRFGPVDRPDAAPALALFGFDNQPIREAVERSLSVALEDDKRQMTALAIAESRADILCLQEVDNLGVLEAFFANYVHRVADFRYGHFHLIRGNDGRGIDVAFCCRRDLLARDRLRFRSHRESSYADFHVHDIALDRLGVNAHDPVFKRDCLEMTLDLDGHDLSIFVLHLKSMNNGRDDGRMQTAPLRRAEVRAVKSLVRDRFGADWRHANWVIAGDLNDYVETIGRHGVVTQAEAGAVHELLNDFAWNPVETLPQHERWTHFHKRWQDRERRLIEEHVQLDYVLLSPALKQAFEKVEIIRGGQPYRVPLDPREDNRSIAHLSAAGRRYPRIGWDRPKASDHCPVVVTLDLR
ncbi:MAG: endonuclease/exonuclease/phosphatase family protein [Beijerinckiaceae bacterium]